MGCGPNVSHASPPLLPWYSTAHLDFDMAADSGDLAHAQRVPRQAQMLIAFAVVHSMLTELLTRWHHLLHELGSADLTLVIVAGTTMHPCKKWCSSGASAHAHLGT